VSSLASLALQSAVHVRLSSDDTLIAAVGGVFDAVPKQAQLPYLVLGPVTAVPWSAKSFSGQRHRLVVRMFSEAPGDAEIKALADRVHGLLDRAALSLEGHHLVDLGFDGLQTLRDPEGIRQAELRFSALTHPL